MLRSNFYTSAYQMKAETESFLVINIFDGPPPVKTFILSHIALIVLLEIAGTYTGRFHFNALRFVSFTS